MTLLSIEGLSVAFTTRTGTVRALDRVSLHVARGETLGVVGESGSGKSVTALAVLRLLDPAARITAGRVLFEGQDVLRLRAGNMTRLRGRRIGMVFQSPRTSLSPIHRVGDQIGDVLRAHGRNASEAVELLARVQIPDPVRRARAYPFELSGGMCQRVMIALALAGRPDLLIADEPTTGLDVTMQAEIMRLIATLSAEAGMACIFITHDLLLAATHCDRIAVMHAGQVVETASIATLFQAPRHPYTARLIAATPRPTTVLGELGAVPGAVPDLRQDLPACRFMPRCERALSICATDVPLTVVGDHALACGNPR